MRYATQKNINDTVFTPEQSLDILLHLPEQLIYPFWQIDGIRFEAEHAFYRILELTHGNLKSLTSEQQILLQQFLYKDCMKTVRCYIKTDHSNHYLTLPNFFITNYTNINIKERRALC